MPKAPLDITVRIKARRATNTTELRDVVRRAARGLSTPGFKVVAIDWHKWSSSGEREGTAASLRALRDFSQVLDVASIRVGLL